MIVEAVGTMSDTCKPGLRDGHCWEFGSLCFPRDRPRVFLIVVIPLSQRIPALVDRGTGSVGTSLLSMASRKDRVGQGSLAAFRTASVSGDESRTLVLSSLSDGSPSAAKERGSYTSDLTDCVREPEGPGKASQGAGAGGGDVGGHSEAKSFPQFVRPNVLAGGHNLLD